AHVGDSRAYHLRDGQLRQLSVDHSFVAELVAMGKITAEEARTHQNRNLLMQALGLGRPLDVDRLAIELVPGDRVLLCSDGLYDLVADHEIEAAMASADDPATLCHELIALANERGGSDNITVISARVDA
ncbi:MAG TPA: SpoIIE family protein phosphatase, partial [Longimicrobiales bacterium]